MGIITTKKLKMGLIKSYLEKFNRYLRKGNPAKKQKNGFNAPFDIWLRGPLNDFAMDIFTSNSFR